MRSAIVIACLLGLTTAVPGQQPTPESENGRFSFKQVPEGLLRLDGRTGQVSLCGKRTVGWACQAAPEDRAALEGEIARLQGENAALKRDLAARAPSSPDAGKGSPAKPDQDLKLPSDADLDRAMSFLERAWRRLIEMVQNMQREMDNERAKKQLEKGGIDKRS